MSETPLRVSCQTIIAPSESSVQIWGPVCWLPERVQTGVFDTESENHCARKATANVITIANAAIGNRRRDIKWNERKKKNLSDFLTTQIPIYRRNHSPELLFIS